MAQKTFSSRRAASRFAVFAAMLCAACHAAGMDFREAYQAAVYNDASIRASRAGADAQRERVPQARSQLLPNIAFSGGRNYNELRSETPNILGQVTRNETTYFSGSQVLSLRQPLYRPYLTAALRQAKALEKDAEATLARDEQTLVVRVGESYFDALLAEDQVRLVAAQKEAYEVQLRASKMRFSAGSGTRTDIDEAQALVDMTYAQELEARQNVDATRHRLATITGQSVQALSTLDEQVFVPVIPVPDSVDAWIARAEDRSPELTALRAQLQAADEEVAKAKAGHLPTLDAVAQWSRTNSDNVTSVRSRYDNRAVGLQLNVPLYSGGYVNSTVRQAVASRVRAEEVLEATRRDLAVRVRQEFRGMTEGVVRIRALEQAVRSADQAVLSNRRSFEAGMRTTVDVLGAEQQRTLALRDLAQARYRYVVARLRLLALAGEDRDVSVSAVNAWLK